MPDRPPHDPGIGQMLKAGFASLCDYRSEPIHVGDRAIHLVDRLDVRNACVRGEVEP